MSTFIQIHALTSHSTHCLNRDDLGHPKTVEFLGRNHGRISSQCQKRAIRDYMKLQEMAGDIGVRTKKLPLKVRDFLRENGVDDSLVLPLIPFIGALGEKKDPTKPVVKEYIKLSGRDDLSAEEKKKVTKAERTAQLIHIKQPEIEIIKQSALDACREGGKADDVKKYFKKAIEKKLKKATFKDGVDIALFGRMTTSPVFDDCDASVSVAHAMTTHPVFDQNDFFTAVDDLGDEGEGSGHMDDKAFSSGIFYRYASIHYDQLLKNMGNDKKLADQAVDGFLKAFVMALPTGSQNGFAAFQQPYAVLITTGTGCPTNLSNAFASDVKAASPLEKAVRQLVAEFGRTQTFFGDLKPVDRAAVTCQYGEFLPEDLGGLEKKETLGDLLVFVPEAI